MFKRLTFLLLSIFLLAEMVTTAPANAPGPPSSEESVESNENANSRQQLFASIAKKHLAILDYALEQAADIMQKVIKDEAIVQSDSELMRAEVAYFGDFVRMAQVARNEQPPKDSVMSLFFFLLGKSTIYRELLHIAGKHNTALLHMKPKAESYVIEASLKQNGIEALRDELSQRRTKLYEWALESIDAYIKRLTAEERKREQRLIDFYNQYKGQTGERLTMDMPSMLLLLACQN